MRESTRKPVGKLRQDAAAEAPDDESSQRPARPQRPCKQYALWLLGRREWAEQELRSRLKLKGYGADEIDDCMTFCQHHGLQSDERFAGARTRSRSRQYGNRKLRAELRDKGVPDDVAQGALDELVPEEQRARALLSRFDGQDPDLALKAKVWRYLAARGFSSSVVERAWRDWRTLATDGAPD